MDKEIQDIDCKDLKCDIVLYQPDENIHLEVRLDPDTQTVWLTQAQIGQLYGKAKSTISEHITHIFEEGELDPHVVVRENRTTTRHGAIENKTQENTTRFYNLDAILAVGFRVRSNQGTMFRQWAIERLKSYIIKGFAIDSDRLKGPSTPFRTSLRTRQNRLKYAA